MSEMNDNSQVPNDPARDVEYLLSQYLDGALTRRQTVRLERRLAEDPALGETLARYAALDGCIDQWALPPEVSRSDLEGQRHQVRSVLERRALLEGPARRGRRRWVRLAAPLAAAAVLILAVTVGLILAPDGASTQAPVVAVDVLSATPAVEAESEVAVGFNRLGWDEVRLDAPGGTRTAAPPGTVLVSVGSHEPPAAVSTVPLWTP